MKNRVYNLSLVLTEYHCCCHGSTDLLPNDSSTATLPKSPEYYGLVCV